MAVGCTRSNLCTSLIKSPVSSSHVSSRYCFFSPKLVQNILQKIHIDIDGSKNDPKGFVSNYGHSGWKKNCHSVAFNVFFWDQSDFYCPGRNCPWLLHIGNLMSWLWKYQTLIISWAATAPTCGMMPWFWSCCFNRAFSCCNASTWQNAFNPILLSL